MLVHKDFWEYRRLCNLLWALSEFLFIYTILTPVIMENKNWQLDKTNIIW